MPFPPPDLSQMMRPNWIEINLDSLAHNIQVVREKIPPGTKILLPVKADAYGHGSLACSYAAEFCGVDFLGVAHMAEGILLRQYGIGIDILILGPCIPEDFPYLVEFRLTPSVSDEKTALLFDDYLRENDVTAKAHLKIDTGMNRYGIAANCPDTIQKLLRLSHLKFEGIFTHFATADFPDHPNTKKQTQAFQKLLTTLESAGLKPPLIHAANSAATFTHPETHFNLVRPGIALYGYNPMGNFPTEFPLKPLMKMKATIRMIHDVETGESVSYGSFWTASKKTRVATVAIGYGDGYLRGNYNEGVMFLRGKLCPILGRVCMDATMIDVSEIPEAAVGDTVDVIDGEAHECISMEAIAEMHRTIPYEIACRVARRLYRKYHWRGKNYRWDDLKKEFQIPEFKEYPCRK